MSVPAPRPDPTRAVHAGTVHPKDSGPEYTAGASVALLLALVGPLGLSSGEVADQTAHAFGVRSPMAMAAPLADVLTRAFALLPMGDAGARGQGVAALAAAIALALSVATVRRVSFGLADRRPRGRPAWSSAAPPIALAMSLPVFWPILTGIVLLAVCRPFLETATAHPATAIDFGLLMALVLTLERVRSTPGRASFGLALAFLCGLGAGVGWPVRAATWPGAMVLVMWALRRGERWPLLAPTLFVAGAGVALAGVVGAPPGVPATMRAMVHHILIPEPAGVPDGARAREILAWVIDDVGILGLLVAVVGTCLMVPRARGQSALMLSSWVVAIVASLGTGNILATRLFVAAAMVAPVAAAVAFFTASFGRARTAVAAVMIVIIVLPPAVVGIGGAMRLPARRQPAVIARGLDAALSARSPDVGPPADPEAARWWRYGIAIGLWRAAVGAADIARTTKGAKATKGAEITGNRPDTP